MKGIGAWLLLMGVGAGLGCGDDPSMPVDPCGLQDLPLRGQVSGPTVTDVALEDQGGQRIVVLATATDPQGDADLLGVVQTLKVFRNKACEGAPIVLQDDLAGSGVEESFGTAVDTTTDASLYREISDSDRWPVALSFQDAGGNTVEGRVAARVFR